MLLNLRKLGKSTYFIPRNRCLRSTQLGRCRATRYLKEVLHFVAAGNSNAEIAGRLHLSTRSVELHRARAMMKLGMRNQTELIRFALRRGLVSLED
jgi:DNA-binding NarL/FixJ family response regulator